MIPYSRQTLDNSDRKALLRVMKSDFLTQGPEVPEFEKALSQKVQARHAVAMVNATASLHVACLALGVGSGDIVWTSAISFVASANCAVYCGASVDFVDVDPLTGNMSIHALKGKLEAAEISGGLPKVVIPVHFAGQPMDMKAIGELASRFGFRVIEDASHALGAIHSGEVVGSNAYSDITVFSFHPVKMVTTAEGGAAVTNSAELANRMQRLRSHGITRDPNEIEQEFEGGWFYDQIELGFNYRMTDLLAALGKNQLEKLDTFVAARKQVARIYDQLLDGDKFEVLSRDPLASSSWHLFVVLVKDSETRKELFENLRTKGILVNVHYRPIYRQTYYAKTQKYDWRDFPGAESFYQRAISLPIFPDLKRKQVLEIVKALGTPIGFQGIF